MLSLASYASHFPYVVKRRENEVSQRPNHPCVFTVQSPFHLHRQIMPVLS